MALNAFGDAQDQVQDAVLGLTLLLCQGGLLCLFAGLSRYCGAGGAGGALGPDHILGPNCRDGSLAEAGGARAGTAFNPTV